VELLLLAFLVAVEGPIATLLGAAAASANTMRLSGVFAAAAAGNLLADTLWYALGYFGHVKVIYRFGKWIGVKPEQIAQFSTVLFPPMPYRFFSSYALSPLSYSLTTCRLNATLYVFNTMLLISQSLLLLADSVNIYQDSTS
jgi:hypothetical protein